MDVNTSPGYEYILPGQIMFGQELLQGSAQVSFIAVHGRTVEGPITCSQRRVHCLVDIVRSRQLAGPQAQEGHFYPCI